MIVILIINILYFCAVSEPLSKSHSVHYGKCFHVFPKSLTDPQNPRAPHAHVRLAVPVAGQPSNTWPLTTVLQRQRHKMWEQSPILEARWNRAPTRFLSALSPSLP